MRIRGYSLTRIELCIRGLDMRSVDGAIGPSFFLELALLWLDLRVLARTDSDLPSHVVVAFGSE